MSPETGDRSPGRSPDLPGQRRRAPAPAGMARIAAAFVAAGLLTAGCSTPAAPAPSSTPSPAGTAISASSPTTVPTAATSPAAGPDKLLLIVEENRSVGDVTAHMPFLMAQARRYGRTADFSAIRHPSLPNYLVLAGGSTFGVTDDDGPEAHPIDGPSVFGALLGRGRTVKTYAEAAPTSCAQANSGSYAVRHNPWTYFTSAVEQAACRRLDVPAGTTTRGALATDVTNGTLPNFSLVIPDICNDGHDCSAQTADHWLREWLPAIQRGPDFRGGRLIAVVTWDEDDGTDHNRVLTVVIHPSLHEKTVLTPLDHFGLSASILAMQGGTPLRDARGATDVLRAFGLT